MLGSLTGHDGRQFITKLEANAPFVSKKTGSISDWKRDRESREVDGMELVDHQEDDAIQSHATRL